VKKGKKRANRLLERDRADSLELHHPRDRASKPEKSIEQSLFNMAAKEAKRRIFCLYL